MKLEPPIAREYSSEHILTILFITGHRLQNLVWVD